MKNIVTLTIVIVLLIVLLAAWGKLSPGKDTPSGNPIEKGTQQWAEGVSTGALTGVGNSVGGFEAGVISGISKIVGGEWSGLKDVWGALVGTNSTVASGNGAGPLIGADSTPTWSGVSQGNPFLGTNTVPAAPLPYGNPPAGLAQAGSSVNYGGDLLLSALQPE